MIREATLDEREGYCLSTWYRGATRGRPLRTSTKAALRASCARLLATQTVIVMGLEPLDTHQPSTLLGWCCVTRLASTSVLHYVYVRHRLNGVSLRRQGRATALLAAAGVDLTRTIHTTYDQRKGKGDKGWRCGSHPISSLSFDEVLGKGW